MSVLDDLIQEIADENLRRRIEKEIADEISLSLTTLQPKNF